jgi:uncharacterized membrane protein YheB (UPF0754 family)
MEEENNVTFSFLEEMTNTAYTPSTPTLTKTELAKQERERKREEKVENKEREKEAKAMIKQAKQDAKINNAPIKKKENDELFADEATVILGREKIILMKQIRQYKSLFPEELNKFKIKKNPNADELKNALQEMEVLVETGGVNDFMMDSVIQSIKMIEGVSAYSSKYDIRGCADLLKSNKQFHSLCKQLFIKYQIFSQVPCEYQLLFLVATTAYIANNKNKNKHEINAYLNEPIKI